MSTRRSWIDYSRLGLSASKLAIIQQTEQTIHNLKMRVPVGIKSIDDAFDEKRKRLEKSHKGDKV